MVETVTKWHWLNLDKYAFIQVCTGSCCFDGQINGNPTSTQIPYDNDIREDSLPEEGVMGDCLGRMILFNTTKNNAERKIEYCDYNANIIHTESSTDNWENDDLITIKNPIIGSNYITMDFSDILPSEASSCLIAITFSDSDSLNFSVDLHPIYLYSGDGKNIRASIQVLGREMVFTTIMEIVTQKLGISYVSGIGGEIYVQMLAYTTEINIPTTVTSRLVSPKGIRIP